MAVNPSPSLLDINQISQRTFDSANDAIRMSLGSTSFAVSLDAADGDNVATKGLSATTKVSLTNASTGIVLPAADCAGYKTFQIYTKTTSTLTDPQVCTLETSPSDTDDVWFATSATVTPSGTNGVAVASTAISAAARRARVSIAAAITSGTFDLYLVKQGS
jgi:hypothetical protein